MTQALSPHRDQATRRDPRRIATAVVAVLYGVGTALASFGLPSLLTAWTTSGDELELRTQFVAWGLLAGVLIPVMALALLRRPLVAPAQQLAAFAAAAVVALGLALEPENARYTVLFAVPAVVLVLLHPARRTLWSAGAWDPMMLAVAGLGAVPAAVYAVDNLRTSAGISYLDDLHGGHAHAGLLALALMFSAVVAARRASGWGWVAGSTAFCTAVLGVAGLLFPDDPSSLGTTGGTIALGLATLLTAAASRRTGPVPD
jgi:hypothetical protein